MNVVEVPDVTTVDREILWAKAYLQPFVGGLTQFLTSASDFQRGLAYGDHTACERALNEIESRYGLSLWLIKTRIAYLQFAAGQKPRSEYAKGIIKGANEQGFVAYITHYFNQQNEATMTTNSFSALMQPRFRRMRPQAKDVADYLEFHLFPNVDIDASQIANILCIESTGAVVDYYETLLRLSRIILSKGASDLFPVMESSLGYLSEACDDPRLEMLLFELREGNDDNDRRFSSTPAAIEALNSFLKGSYAESLTGALQELEISGDNFDLVELSARACSVWPDGQTANVRVKPVLDAMCSLILADSNALEATAYLSKLSLNFNGHSWADSLRGFIVRETSPYFSPENLTVKHYAASGLPTVSPLRLDSFSKASFKRRYALLNRRMYGEQLCVLYAESLIQGAFNDDLNRELSHEQSSLLKAETLIASKDFTEALAEAQRLLKSRERYYQRKATRIIFYCLLQLGKLRECIDLLTTSYLEEGFDSAVPVKEATTLVAATDDSGLTANISTPILLDIYSKYVGTDFESERRYAYEDFLFANGIQRPSELRAISERFENSKLVYFLRNIAVESIMDDSVIIFSGSRDVAEERVAVCRLLVQLDPNNADGYQAEIREIIGRLMIRKRVREIQRSKIYVDTESIKKKVSRTMRESFNRYKALRGRDDTRPQPTTKMDGDTHSVGSSALLVLPSDEVTELFDSIVLDLRDLFVSSNEHGLDGYLSVRIRHGTLAGELRGPLETANLLTKRDSITGGHKLSPNLRLNASSSVVAALTKFTADYEALINEIISDWIQVKRATGDKGMLDFTLTTRISDALAKEVKEQTTFDEFIEIIFGFFYGMLDIRLKSVRREIGFTAKQRATLLLTRLIGDLESQAANQEMQELVRAIKTAQTELQRVFDRITEWFRLSTTTANEPFSIEDAINISRESVSTFTRGVDTSVTVPNQLQIGIEGRLLNSFVDIMSIIFENIIRHSDLGTRPEAVVKVTLFDNSIQIAVENEIGDGVATEESRNRIATIKKAMEKDEYGKSISKEGGTGFHKIWKFLNHDFKPQEMDASPYLEFGFTDSVKFLVAFRVPTAKEI
jgi:hypothetical protein